MRYLGRRAGFYLLTAWAALTLNFLIPRLMPGNPVELLIGRFKGRLSPEATRSLTDLFGLSHAGLWQQYLTYWGDIFHANLGISFTYFPTPVISVLEEALPWTLVLVGISTVVSFVLGTVGGVWVAWRRGSWIESILPISTFFSAMPYFWFALIILYLLAVALPWFPLSGGYSSTDTIGFSWTFIGSAIYHGFLPALTIIASSIAGWLLGMRNMMVTTLDEDYVLMAKAKGLSNPRVMFGYAARNAVLPSLASFALSLGFVVSGAILVEVVFSYPGIGYVLFAAVSNDDYPLMQGILSCHHSGRPRSQPRRRCFLRAP